MLDRKRPVSRFSRVAYFSFRGKLKIDKQWFVCTLHPAAAAVLEKFGVVWRIRVMLCLQTESRKHRGLKLSA